MENYELILISAPKREHGYFPKGNKPFNKGIPQKEWMDGRKIKKVRKYLEIGRKAGNHNLPRSNKKPVVSIKDGKLIAFKSATDAARILKAKGIRINARNISSVCSGKPANNNGIQYVRKRAGGYQWFFANKTEKYLNLLNE